MNRLIAACIAASAWMATATNAELLESREAVARTLAAAEEGDLSSQARICEHFGFFWTEPLPEKYVEWCEAAVAAGDIGAMSRYASRMELGIGTERQVRRALLLYLRAADKGDPWAHMRLGVHYRDGAFLAKDDGEACKHFQEAGEQPAALEALGACYEDGVAGFPKDVQKAVQYYERSTQNTHFPGGWALFRLGYLYYFGEGIERNPRLAAGFLSKGAAQGSSGMPSGGFYILGLMYESGEGVAKNDEDAFHSYMKAAEAGHAPSQNKVGAKYAEGKGVAKNMEQALMWFTIAAANGYKDAADNRDKAEKLLKQGEVARVRNRAKEWLDQHPAQ